MTVIGYVLIKGKPLRCASDVHFGKQNANIVLLALPTAQMRIFALPLHPRKKAAIRRRSVFPFPFLSI
jgi:hypothetical protein